MAKFTISVDLPKGVDFVRLHNTPQGWEATCISYATADRWEVPIPSQIGVAFKQRSAELAIKVAAEDARKRTQAILAKRNAAPDPRLSDEDKLFKMLGL